MTAAIVDLHADLCQAESVSRRKLGETTTVAMIDKPVFAHIQDSTANNASGTQAATTDRTMQQVMPKHSRPKGRTEFGGPAAALRPLARTLWAQTGFPEGESEGQVGFAQECFGANSLG